MEQPAAVFCPFIGQPRIHGHGLSRYLVELVKQQKWLQSEEVAMFFFFFCHQNRTVPNCKELSTYKQWECTYIYSNGNGNSSGKVSLAFHSQFAHAPTLWKLLVIRELVFSILIYLPLTLSGRCRGLSKVNRKSVEVTRSIQTLYTYGAPHRVPLYALIVGISLHTRFAMHDQMVLQLIEDYATRTRRGFIYLIN